MAFAEFALTCTFSASFQEILCNKIGAFEAFYEAVNSLLATMRNEFGESLWYLWQSALNLTDTTSRGTYLPQILSIYHKSVI